MCKLNMMTYSFFFLSQKRKQTSTRHTLEIWSTEASGLSIQFPPENWLYHIAVTHPVSAFRLWSGLLEGREKPLLNHLCRLIKSWENYTDSIDLQLPNLLSLALGMVIKVTIHNQYSEIRWQAGLLDCMHISCFVPRGNFTIKDAI